MTTEELKEKVKVILDSSLEGVVHPELENVMQEIVADYETGFSSGENDTYKAKYEELKEKYIERFVNGGSAGEEYLVEDTTEEEEKDDKEESEIKIDDLFDEKEE